MPRASEAKGRYAYGTTTPAESTQAEIARVLKKNGASQHGFGEEERGGVVFFTMRGRQIRFTVPYPAKDPVGRDAEIKRRWRCMLIAIKSKFEAVTVAGELDSEEAAAAFKMEFLAQTVLPNGKTVGQHAMPLVDAAYGSGQMPRLLLPGIGGDDDEG